MKKFSISFVFLFSLFTLISAPILTSNIMAEEFVGGIKADDYDKPVDNNNNEAGSRIGVYGFYLGQTIQEVLNNAAQKGFKVNFDFQAGEEQLLKELRQLPNGQNITDNPGTHLSLLPKVLEVIYGKQEYSQLAGKFNESLNIIGKSLPNSLKHHFLELSVYRDENIPPIYLGFIIDKSLSTIKLYQIKLSIDQGDYNNNSKLESFINKVTSTITSRYGEFLNTSNESVKVINIHNNLVIATRFYDAGIYREFGFYFYDNGLISTIINSYIDAATKISNDSTKKAFDDM